MARHQNLVTSVDLVTKAVNAYVTREKEAEDGLLRSVEEIIPYTYNDTPIDPPVVWIVQHPTITNPDYKKSINNRNFLQSTFEFVCVEYDEDLQTSIEKGQKLATLVGQSIMKNFNKIAIGDDEIKHIFTEVEFNTLYPVGEVSIAGKATRVPATSIVFDFTFEIDWLKCHI